MGTADIHALRCQRRCDRLVWTAGVKENEISMRLRVADLSPPEQVVPGVTLGCDLGSNRSEIICIIQACVRGGKAQAIEIIKSADQR